MSQYRSTLPQLGKQPFITDGGMETTLVFHRKMDLPSFAAFTLLATEQGRQALMDYWQPYIDIAKRHGAGMILETPTWRANPDWGQKLGYDAEALHRVNLQAVAEIEKLRAQHANATFPMVISGNIGPRGDGYVPNHQMTAREACDYHLPQIQSFATTAADMVCAMTLNTIEEGIGIARAAKRANMPVCLSFTVETDGRLPTGETLQSAIEAVDEDTQAYPAYYMVNCAHPTHFQALLDGNAPWTQRIFAIRANASQCSHQELDEAEVLDEGNPKALGLDYLKLKSLLKNLRIYGGCCGTDHRHIEAVCVTCI